MTEAPSSRVSSVVSMLGDLTAFAASFLIFGDAIAAGALGIAQFYVLDPDVETWIYPLSFFVEAAAFERRTADHSAADLLVPDRPPVQTPG
jgi:hypothetical protein